MVLKGQTDEKLKFMVFSINMMKGLLDNSLLRIRKFYVIFSTANCSDLMWGQQSFSLEKLESCFDLRSGRRKKKACLRRFRRKLLLRQERLGPITPLPSLQQSISFQDLRTSSEQKDTVSRIL